jgi:hypothetical protein
MSAFFIMVVGMTTHFQSNANEFTIKIILHLSLLLKTASIAAEQAKPYIFTLITDVTVTFLYFPRTLMVPAKRTRGV